MFKRTLKKDSCMSQYEILLRKIADQQKERVRRRQRRDYWRHHKDRLNNARDRHKRNLLLMRRILGERCSVCNTEKSLVFHHLRYERKGYPGPTFKAIQKNNVVLVCRKHHRAIQLVNTLKQKGHLDKILTLLNEKPMIQSSIIKF